MLVYQSLKIGPKTVPLPQKVNRILIMGSGPALGIKVLATIIAILAA